jgi:hypothetical protein
MTGQPKPRLLNHKMDTLSEIPTKDKIAFSRRNFLRLAAAGLGVFIGSQITPKELIQTLSPTRFIDFEKDGQKIRFLFTIHGIGPIHDGTGIDSQNLLDYPITAIETGASFYLPENIDSGVIDQLPFQGHETIENMSGSIMRNTINRGG